MSEAYQPVALQGLPPRRRVTMRWGLVAGALLLGLALAGLAGRPLAAGADRGAAHQVSGAGKTIIEGGTGGNSPTPVITTLAFHANSQGGDFECLAFVPASATGAGSGDFNVNAMYVTGKVTSLNVDGNTARLRGIANVTGLGAGQNKSFTAWVTGGGPGTTVKLVISGLTFNEILLEGNIDVK